MDIFVFNKYQFWEEALLFRVHNVLYYPGWTLSIELLVSFLIPFYIALALKDKQYIPYLIVVTLIMGNNLCFSYMFLLGIIASTNYSYIAGASFRQTTWYKYRIPVLALAFVIFSIRQIDYILPFSPTFKYIQAFLGLDFFSYTGLSCFVFLVGILHSKQAQHFLENRLLVFLGKISYSIYLVHVLVINVLYVFVEKYITFPPKVSTFTCITLMAVASVIVVATAMHYIIELPFIRLGKFITGKMKPSLIIQKDR